MLHRLRSAIQAWRAAGIFPAFAAGNYGPGAGSARTPGADADSFAVGATTSTDTIASFSGQGPSVCDGLIKPDISAPGVGIRSAYRGGWASLNGTSMGHAARDRCVALLRSIDQTLTVNELETILTQTAVDLGTVGPDNAFGAGRLDVAAAADLVLARGATGPDDHGGELHAGERDGRRDAVGDGHGDERGARGGGRVHDAVTNLSANSVKDAGDTLLTGSRSVPVLPAQATSSGTVQRDGGRIDAGGDVTVCWRARTTSGWWRRRRRRTTARRPSTTCRSPAPLPDLTATAVSFSPAERGAGRRPDGDGHDGEHRQAVSAASTTRYYLSVDTAKDAGDTLLTGSRGGRRPGRADGVVGDGGRDRAGGRGGGRVLRPGVRGTTWRRVTETSEDEQLPGVHDDGADHGAAAGPDDDRGELHAGQRRAGRHAVGDRHRDEPRGRDPRARRRRGTTCRSTP
jgi:hypothetical protein